MTFLCACFLNENALFLPLGCFSDDMDFPRSWLVPVIRDHVKGTQLAYFSSYFMPLAATLRQRGGLASAVTVIFR